MDGKIWTQEATDLKKTPKGHTEPQHLVNEELCTTIRQCLKSLWGQATRPWVNLHSNRASLLLFGGSIHGNMTAAVVKGSPSPPFLEGGLLGTQLRIPHAKDHNLLGGVELTQQNWTSSYLSHQDMNLNENTSCVYVCVWGGQCSILFNTI